jgi:hypothetical protein
VVVGAVAVGAGTQEGELVVLEGVQGWIWLGAAGMSWGRPVAGGSGGGVVLELGRRGGERGGGRSHPQRLGLMISDW